MWKKNFQIRSVILVAQILLVGCAKDGRSFSLLADSNAFTQEKTTSNKVDVIWVIDGSGTMANHQANLATNFNKFISQFGAKGFDYQMVVASTDSWLREVNYNGGACSSNPNPTNDPNKPYVSSADCFPTLTTFGAITQFRDGDIYGSKTGVPGIRSGNYLISSAMLPNDILTTFAINAAVGTRGDGSRESAFQSLRGVLRLNENAESAFPGENHTVLSSFRRPDAFLAVIIVTDEDDQSRKADGTAYASPEEYSTQFVHFLDQYTTSTEGNRRYNVSGIVVDDINNCSYGLHNQARQGDRYVSIANATRGIVGNICSPDFSDQLTGISERIVTLATRFRLTREPVPSTIKIRVNGELIPEGEENGWTYLRETDEFQYIEFHGDAVPAEGATINVDFDPVKAKN